MIICLELHGNHYDLVMVPTARSAREALKPRWAVRSEAMPHHPLDEDWDALEHLHALRDALEGFLGGYHKVCDIKA